MNILVTGGAGFIGSHLANELLKQGHSVRIIDNLSTGKIENIPPEANLMIGDIRDDACLRGAVQNIDIIFHLAAFTSVPLSFVEKETCLEINEVAFSQLLHHASRAGVAKIVFSSSSAVFPDNFEGALSESSPIKPSSPYGKSKYRGEIMLREWCKNENGRSGTALRYFNVYGPKQDQKSDYASVIPRFMKLILENECLTIYGTGHQTRDFIYVDDVVRANILSSQLPNYNCFVVGTGEATSVLKLVSMLEKIANVPLEFEYMPLPKGDALSSCADISQIRRCGWKVLTEFKKGLKMTWDSYFDQS